MKVNGIKNILSLIDKEIEYVPFDDIYDTLQDASMLQFDFAKQLCIKKLQENISIDNCLRIWLLADQLDIHPLAEKAKSKALMEFNDVKDTDSIYILNIKQLHSYLSNTLLHCDNEIDVIETGLKWWYDFSKKDSEIENCENEEKPLNETKYLLVLLRCLDYNSMTKSDIDNIFLVSPDMRSNRFINNVLVSIAKLINDEQVSDQTLEERMAVEFIHNCRKRRLSYLPCVVCHDFVESFSKKKRSKFMGCNCVNTVNVYYYGKYYFITVIYTIFIIEFENYDHIFYLL